jgi:hypothetical protein
LTNREARAKLPAAIKEAGVRAGMCNKGGSRMKKLLMVIALLFVAKSANAQEQYVELLRSDLKAQKVAIVTQGMALQEGQSEQFWKIYRDYDYELASLTDRRIALIKDYAANFSTMTDAKADEIAMAAMKLDKDRLALREKYYKKYAKEMSPVLATRWAQLERVIATVFDLQIASELPLIQEGWETPPPSTN